jgi:hypothetical protein
MERVYGYSVFYRPVAAHLVGDTPDERPVSRLPSIGGGWFPSEAERERHLARTVADLEEPRQGYRVERVVREATCARCEGRGDVAQKPKGWRKKTAPPWFLCSRVPCPACAGRPALDSQTVDLVGEALHG